MSFQDALGRIIREGDYLLHTSVHGAEKRTWLCLVLSSRERSLSVRKLRLDRREEGGGPRLAAVYDAASSVMVPRFRVPKKLKLVLEPPQE